MQIARPLPAAALLLSACALGEVHEVDRFIEAEVAADGASTVVLDVPVPARIVGTSRDVLTFTGTVTVVTSSLARSRELAAALEIREEREGSTLTAGLQVPGQGAGTFFPEATLRGNLDIRVPAGVVLEVIQRGGTTVVEGMTRAIDVRSVGPVQVIDALASVSVRTDNGPVEIETRAAAGSRTFLGMVAGAEARIVLPRSLNARVVAQTSDGQIFLSHPQLPPGPADPYVFTAGSGAADVEVSVSRGNVVLLAR